MKRKLALAAATFAVSSFSMAFSDQHSVEAIQSVLVAPIPEEALAKAREYDDQLMRAGKIGDVKTYLITDQRNTRITNITNKLLTSMGEDPSQWIVRIVEDEQDTVNAFVTGGKYIYVYDELIKQATGDDELAFVLSHELGHSMLQHVIRRENDATSTLVNLAVVIAAASEKHRDTAIGVAKIMGANYSQVDETESDSIAVAIALRAGYDPMRGIDFFTRGKREVDRYLDNLETEFRQLKAIHDQALAKCLGGKQYWDQHPQYHHSQELANEINGNCSDADAKGRAYTEKERTLNAAKSQHGGDDIYSTHPANNDRIACIAATVDFLQQRRNLDSLSKYQQTHRVMTALSSIDSELLKASPVTANNQSPPVKATVERSLAEKLQQLKSAFDAGLLTQSEYEEKRARLIEGL